MELGKFSIGVGDRFTRQARAQLGACLLAQQHNTLVTPVWNKSNREHTIIGSEPHQTRAAVDAAVQQLCWKHAYFCDADHINLTTVDRYIEPCDFYTIDVADYIGKATDSSAIDDFVHRHAELQGAISLGSMGQKITISPEKLRATASTFLYAVQEAGKVFRKIEAAKGSGNFITEISMDETEHAQTPEELLIILAAIADEGIPVQTIAPKFSGRFNKGVDYVGDVAQFGREMTLDMAAIRYAVEHYGLPANLKLSVHSGSDKFSIYPAIHRAMLDFSTGVHLKTAGTTWLEELIGLAEAGDEALELAKEIYSEAHSHSAELCAPYATVIDIDATRLPSPSTVKEWSPEEFTGALRHDPKSKLYNPNVRQLLHVGFKIAAKMGPRYIGMVEANELIIARNVTENLYARHIAPVFLGHQA
ncbi:tagaturonate epimerase family protein [Silvibacterium acidisoli]|uniref:tagaturonate epimerase family protein n=1 Tax=Acidobacteriaceae bacterium ZG23-2 TaxID=2883246 RepID=UPI00406C0577